MTHWFVYYMLKASVLVQILINSFCFDLTSVQLLESYLHSFTQILLRYFVQIYLLCQHLLTWESSCSDLTQILLRYLAQILLKFICFVNTCQLENLLAQISCSNFTQILLKSCSDLFALSTLVNLRIFLLKSYSNLAQILLRSYSDILLKSCSNLAQIYLLC